MDIYARKQTNGIKKQLLENHLLETSKLASKFGEDFSLSELLKLAGLLHDFGKYTKSWQQYLEDSIAGKKRENKDHATVGGQFIEHKLSTQISLAEQIIQAIVMFHHGQGLPDFLNLNGETDFKKRLEKNDTKLDLLEIESNISKNVKAEIQKCLESGCLKNDALEFKKKCFIGCENISTKEEKIKKLSFNMGLHLRNLSSCLIDADRTNSADFDNDEKLNLQKYEEIPDWKNLLQKLESKLATFENDGKLGEIRKNLSDSCLEFGGKEKGIYSCSAMTGAGKTLASLRFALKQAETHKMKNIFIIAPYTSILDQNAQVIRDILEDEETKGKIVLECHSNLSDEKKDDIYGDEFKAISETWDAPVIVTTMVQFLETLFAYGTKKIRRMHKLFNSVLVFDEIQTLPIKCTYLFNWGIEYLVNTCGCSTLLCTATQPGLDRIGDELFRINLPKENEVIKNVYEHYESLQRVEFIDKTNFGTNKSDIADVVDYIKEEMKTCKSFLAVVNTKPQAKELFEKVKESGCAKKVYHLSTNMCPAHRKEIFSEIQENLDKGVKVICVSTRLIEAGVDLSFDGALRYLAGLDSIIQTAGRCNRNGKCENLGKVAIFEVEDEKLGSLEELKLGKEVMQSVLYEFQNRKDLYQNNLIHPKLIDMYFDFLYKNKKNKFLKYDIPELHTTVLDLLSDNEKSVDAYFENNPEKDELPFDFIQSFETAWKKFEVIADVTTGIIVQDKNKKYGNEIVGKIASLEKNDDYYKKLSEFLKDAQKYSVNVYSNKLNDLLSKGIIREAIPNSEIYVLNEGFYSDEFGLSEEFVGMTVNIC